MRARRRWAGRLVVEAVGTENDIGRGCDVGTTIAMCAGVAELADARDLGSRVRKDVQVRFLSPAFF